MTLLPLTEPDTERRTHPLRNPCKRCGAPAGSPGYIRTVGTQDVVRCRSCDAAVYNAPKTETGRAVRSVKTTHEAITTKTRARIIMRSCGACDGCHCSDKPLHVGHVVSVARATELGWTDAEINSDENLIALCDECNLGLGSEVVPARVLIGIVMSRLKREKDKR